jgi:vancomycin aglycone glucosyltransferase
MPHNRRPEWNLRGLEIHDVRVLLSTYDSRGGIEPLAALGVKLRELGAEAVVCGPPDCAERLAEVGLPLVPTGDPVRALVHRATPPSPDDMPRLIGELIATWFDTVTPVAGECDAMAGTGVVPAAVGARSVAEKVGIPFAHVHYCPVDNVRDYLHGDHPWLAADPVLAPWPEPASTGPASTGPASTGPASTGPASTGPASTGPASTGPASTGVVQTGAWIMPDERPLPPDLEAFLDAGPPPVYVGFGSMRTPGDDIARVAIEAIRGQGRRVLLARGWADLALVDDQDDCFAVGEVNQQALFGRVAAVVHHGGAGTTTTATRAGAPQVVVPQWGDQPYFAGRVAELGIGAAHAVQAPTAESLGAALGTALDPGTRARAKAVAGTIRTDGTTVAAGLLLSSARA